MVLSVVAFWGLSAAVRRRPRRDAAVPGDVHVSMYRNSPATTARDGDGVLGANFGSRTSRQSQPEGTVTQAASTSLALLTTRHRREVAAGLWGQKLLQKGHVTRQRAITCSVLRHVGATVTCGSV